jgi:ABC-2 type transport system permease protein
MSSLPVGVVDYDKSDSSKQLVLSLQKVETLRIAVKSEPELQKLLMDEVITSIFIIEKGYEDKLKAGDLKKIITMYYKEDNKSASILSDIIAGEMIYPVCFYKSLRYYRQLPFDGSMLTDLQYEEYMEKLLESSKDFDFAFRTIYEAPGKKMAAGQQLSNSVLYNQLIFGILGIFIAFIAMFLMSGTVLEKEMGVEVRLRISRFHIVKRDFGNIIVLLVTEGVLAILFSWLIYNHLHIKDGILWTSIYLLLLLNALVLGLILLLIAKMIKKMHIYQVVSSVLILLTGGLGFYHLLTGFYQGYTDNMLKFIPNSWFIQGFTDIIVYGSEGGYLKEGHRVMLYLAMILILLVIGIDIIQGFRLSDFRRNNRNRTVN